MTYTFLLDPLEVLGVSADASLQELQGAYRAKVKTYHPDVGGEPWAFRVVVRSYELLSTARVLGRVSQEMRPPPAPGPGPAPTAAADAPTAGEARAGVRETNVLPERQVAVEMLLIRFEIDTPLGLFLATDAERNLSCTLSVHWPADPDARPGPDQAARLLPMLRADFDAVARGSRALSKWSRVENDRFIGWLTFPSALKADEAFHTFHAALARHEFGVLQTIRDVTIPRSGPD